MQLHVHYSWSSLLVVSAKYAQNLCYELVSLHTNPFIDCVFSSSDNRRERGIWCLPKLVFLLFHKLHNVIATNTCYCVGNLSIKSKNIYVKVLALRSKSWMVSWPPSSSHHLVPFEHTKNKCICVSTISSQNTHESSQWMPRERSYARVGRQCWAIRRHKKARTRCGIYIFHIEFQRVSPPMGVAALISLECMR